MKDYDSSYKIKFIAYVDANGWAMSQHLAYGKFKWLSPKKKKLNLM